MIVIYLMFLVAIIVYYTTRSTPNKKQTYRNAKAGDVEHISPLTSSINDLSNKSFKFDGENVNVNDYEIFIVDGESMGRCGIHTGNGVLVTCLFDKGQIESGKIVVYQIDPDRYIIDHPDEDSKNRQFGFKIRQFLGYVDLSEDNNAIYEKIKNIDNSLLDSKYKEILFTKLTKARNYINNKKVTISITYKNNGIEKDYSVHTLSELYGIVKYVIPDELIKNR